MSSDPDTLDYADAAACDLWLRHPVLGDPSFDSFVRAAGNPVHRGEPPFEWPVNGFLFEDPVSGDWFAYIGRYLRNYAFGPDKPLWDCVAYRSSDKGGSWRRCGPIMSPGPHRFDGVADDVGSIPDVSVVYDAGRYHLAFDWLSTHLVHADLRNRNAPTDSGVGYASSDRPEGPFVPHRVPVASNKRFEPLAGKYSRLYATTIHRRKKDWLFLTLADGYARYSWGLVAITSPAPTGPYSPPRLVLSLETDRFHPALMEHFPSFVHDGHAYAPATSVAMDRIFQCVWRAPLEAAHGAEAWELHQHGSAWHAEDVEHEAQGIWGQTFSGFVDKEGQLRVLFPCLDRSLRGTINIAHRPWRSPLRKRGFVITAHRGTGLTLTRRSYGPFRVRARVALRGGARLVWAHRAPLGSARHSSSTTPHPICRRSHNGLDLREDSWRVVSVDDLGQETVHGSGKWPASRDREFELSVDDAGDARLAVGSRELWRGPCPAAAGPLGWVLEPDTHLRVEQFEVTGRASPATQVWIHTEAFLATGVLETEWDISESPQFHCGIGAIAKAPGGRVKWNFIGRGVRLWSPRGPGLGSADVLLDGRRVGAIDLAADAQETSSVVFEADGLADAPHALVLTGTSGRLVIDSLEVGT